MAGSNRRKIGQVFEQYARGYLERKGYKILYTNLHIHKEEIDIVARDELGIIHLVEVRSKSTSGFGFAVESLSRAKRQSLMRSAQFYMQKFKISEEDISISLITFDRTDTGYRLGFYPCIDLN